VEGRSHTGGRAIRKDANVKLDAEGGAEATTPKARYLATALSLTLAAASVRSDSDVDHGVAHAGGDTGPRLPEVRTVSSWLGLCSD